jgi:hypothetical protein
MMGSKKMEDVIRNTESKTVRPTKNHPPKLWHIKYKPKASGEPIGDCTKNNFFWYKSPHTRESEIDWLQKRIDELC